MEQQAPALPPNWGVQFNDRSGQPIIDLAAALVSSLGYGDADVLAAIAAALPLGDCPPWPAWSDRRDSSGQRDEPWDSFGGGWLVASAAEANDAAIRLTRQLGSLLPGESTTRYRVITVLGSDHGQTMACRSASGQVTAQEGLSPLLPGFRHVVAAELSAIEKAIDQETVAVMLSPVDWGRGGVPFPADYLAAVRQLCHQQGLLLVIDETRLPPAISGRWFFHQHAAIAADILTLSAGWGSGLPGGMVLVSPSVQSMLDQLAAPAALSEMNYPSLQAAWQTTADKILAVGGPASVAAAADDAQLLWQPLVDEFDFVRAIHTAGLWSVVDFDVPAQSVSQAAAQRRLNWPVSGETSLLACLPLTITTTGNRQATFFQQLLTPLRETLVTIERRTIESS